MNMSNITLSNEHKCDSSIDTRKRILYVKKNCTKSMIPSKLPGIDYALNPYRGCAHGCLYCYAPYVLRINRDDWSTHIEAKINLPSLLRREIAGKSGTIGIGTVTDPYQPGESDFLITRRCLEILTRSNLRVTILTKSDLIARDVDAITKLKNVEIGITITTIDEDYALEIEPRAPPPYRRLEALRKFSQLGVDTYAMIGPILPIVTDANLDALLSEIANTGTKRIMIDKLRFRHGMEEVLASSNCMKDSHFRGLFFEKATSDSFYYKLASRISLFCRENNLLCEEAF